jgi:hypothetical protein
VAIIIRTVPYPDNDDHNWKILLNILEMLKSYKNLVSLPGDKVAENGNKRAQMPLSPKYLETLNYMAKTEKSQNYGIIIMDERLLHGLCCREKVSSGKLRTYNPLCSFKRLALRLLFNIPYQGSHAVIPSSIASF